MPIRHGLLALLAEEPGHGFRLRAQFERRTGGTWPLNVGQVYTTLTRLVRDGLVEEANREAGGSVRYALTEAGRAEVEEWWRRPVGYVFQELNLIGSLTAAENVMLPRELDGARRTAPRASSPPG